MSLSRLSSWFAGGRSALLAAYSSHKPSSRVSRTIGSASTLLSHGHPQLRGFRSGKSFGASTMDPSAEARKKTSVTAAPSQTTRDESSMSPDRTEDEVSEHKEEEKEEEEENGATAKDTAESEESLSELERARRKSDDSWIIQVDSNNQIIGRCKRSSMRRNNLWHRSSYVFVLGRGIGKEMEKEDDSSDYLLIQKRVLTKDYCPGYLDCCTGGIVESDETDLFNAQKEIAEEIGIDLIKHSVDLKYICTVPYRDDHCSVFANVFEIRLDNEELRSSIEIQKTEVESIHWKKIADIESEMELLSSQESTMSLDGESSDDDHSTLVRYCPDSVFVFRQWIAKTSRGSFTDTLAE